MTKDFKVLVVSYKDDGDVFHHHQEVTGEGNSPAQCFRKALDLLAESFPTDKGKHAFIGCSSKSGYISLVDSN